MQTIQFSPDQEQAIETIAKWYQSESPMATLGGLAGTGKTTVTSHLIDTVLPDGVVVATPTGKAAQVLRSKGVRAETIHSVCYSYIGRDAKDKKKLIFDFEGVPCSTLVVDEASMVNGEVHRDLSRSGARLLYVGDYGQLPPVGEDPGIMQELTARLEVVHRQGDDLLDFAHAMRNQEYWTFESPNVVRCKKGSDEAWHELTTANVVICLKNHTRHRTNLQLFFEAMGITNEKAQERYRGLWFERKMHEFFDDFLGRSIKVICTKNAPQLNLWNGSLGRLELEEVTDWGLGGTFVADDGSDISIDISLEGWGTNPGDVDWQQQNQQVALDLGYCITCHKSQGSEWDHVAVLDETSQRTTDRARWRYTAATRARKRVTWIPARM